MKSCVTGSNLAQSSNKIYENINIDTNRVEQRPKEGYLYVPSALIDTNKSVYPDDCGPQEDQESKLSI